ncbi:MAG: T9SS type A sorting domain-containing protein [Saprospiraceae bacterium]|nr:T9SS type A sorting domain-containing protein [Saprospiraceae bacterium]
MTILLCLFCLFGPKVNGQGGFDVTASGGVGWILGGSTVSRDSFIYYVGSSRDAADYIDSNFLYRHMQYISVNKFTGEMSSVQSLDTNYFFATIWADAILHNDSTIVMPLTSGNTPYPTYVVTFSTSDFTILDKKMLDTSQTLGIYINVARFYKSRFGGYYVLGRLDQPDRTTVWRLDDSLNQLWTNHFPIADPFQPYEAENGDLLMAGWKNVYKADCWASQSTCFATMEFVRVDTTGELLVYKENLDGVPRKAFGWHVVNDSTFLFLSGKGRIDTLMSTNFVQISYQRGLVLMNRDLEELSYHTLFSDTFYNSFNKYYLFDMRPVKMGSGLIAVGQNEELIPESDIGAYLEAYTHVIRLTETGDSLWHRKYIHQFIGQDTIVLGSRPMNLVTNSDGSITISGSTSYTTHPELGGGQDFWILHLDSFGCVVPGCQNTTSLEELPLESLDVRVYPNPWQQGPLALYIGEESALGVLSCELYDLQGKEVSRHQFRHAGPTTYLLDRPSLRAGVYILHISGSGRSWSGRVVFAGD